MSSKVTCVHIRIEHTLQLALQLCPTFGDPFGANGQNTANSPYGPTALLPRKGLRERKDGCRNLCCSDRAE